MALTEPPWANLNTGTGARNGTTTHVIGHSTAATPPSSGCSLTFVPTSGSLLVAFVAGGVTHTSSGTGAGSGWTERQSPVSNAEHSLFTKTAAGNDFLQVTHNGSNFPIGWAFYEFPTGSSYTSSTSATTTNDTFPALGSLPGTAQVIIGSFWRGNTSATTGGSGVVSSPWVEDADIYIHRGALTDGGLLYVLHQLNVTSASVTPAFTGTYTPLTTDYVGDRQKIVAAFSVPAADTTAFFAMF